MMQIDFFFFVYLHIIKNHKVLIVSSNEIGYKPGISRFKHGATRTICSNDSWRAAPTDGNGPTADATWTLARYACL